MKARGAIVGLGLLAAAISALVYPALGTGLLRQAGPPEIVAIQNIVDEVHLFRRKAFTMGAWIHNIRVGQVVGLHHHPVRPEMVAILRGVARVRGLRKSAQGPIEREEILEPGSIVFSPPTSIHGYENVGDEPLWCLVFQSPPFDTNHFLDGAPPHSDLDFTVLPWLEARPPRGSEPPAWARADGADNDPWRGPIGFYPGIPGELMRDSTQLAGGDPKTESWMVLLAGAGDLQVGGRSYPVSEPSWIHLDRGPWVLHGAEAGGELVALEYRVEPLELALYLRGVPEWWAWRIRDRVSGLLGD